ncbi:hypothetical protein DSUL_30116 [Desulfovibrionales bacterium]
MSSIEHSTTLSHLALQGGQNIAHRSSVFTFYNIEAQVIQLIIGILSNDEVWLT